ncbi:MAG: Maf family protein [Collinsella sp.]|nr:Maf family protein [Collinsella sp.]
MILASRSPRRIELIEEAGFPARSIPADVDETPLPNETPRDLVERLASSKARAVARELPDRDELVLAADTVVSIDGRILGKPVDEHDARTMLQALSGRTHQVMTGVCIVSSSAPDRALSSFVDITDVEFHPLSTEEIAAYVEGGEPMDKAGAYGIQGAGGRMLVKRIDGDFYNVVGLPISRVVREIRQILKEGIR